MDGIRKQSPFPSLVIRHNSLEPKGSFAEAQAVYLTPDKRSVSELKRLLKQKNLGIVAHFYMDPELQGVLAACDWPHIHIADSLVMAGRSAEMVQAGVRAVIVLGVDFMSENARAMVDAAGYPHIPVYRVSDQQVGCSLAEAAQSANYDAYLRKAVNTPNSLHVIYVNTGLDVKAKAHALLPTITCTSSNVVQLILQAAYQIPEINIWYGPDTYMGENLHRLFSSLLLMDKSEIERLHPGHDHESIRRLLERYHYYQQGACIVHQLFGQNIVERVSDEYPDAFVAAHLEVPGEMFERALQGHRVGSGTVGSTADILDFISKIVKEAVVAGRQNKMQFILGTEAGMITPVVRRIQAILRENLSKGHDTSVEIVFPVSSDAISTTSDIELKVVPGVRLSEGCSPAGGCATCPYMKMNSLDALFRLLEDIDTVDPEQLARLEPQKYNQKFVGKTIAQVGGETILHMQAYQSKKHLSEQLVEDIRRRNH